MPHVDNLSQDTYSRNYFRSDLVLWMTTRGSYTYLTIAVMNQRPSIFFTRQNLDLQPPSLN